MARGKRPLRYVSERQIDGGKLCWIDLQDYTRKLSQVFSKISLDIFWRARVKRVCRAPKIIIFCKLGNNDSTEDNTK
jgi:hypothetical protein